MAKTHPEPIAEQSYHIHKMPEDEVHGPYSVKQLKNMMTSGLINRETQIHASTFGWRALADCDFKSDPGGATMPPWAHQEKPEKPGKLAARAPMRAPIPVPIPHESAPIPTPVPVVVRKASKPQTANMAEVLIDVLAVMILINGIYMFYPIIVCLFTGKPVMGNLWLRSGFAYGNITVFTLLIGRRWINRMVKTSNANTAPQS